MNPLDIIKNFMGGGKTPQEIVTNMIGNNTNPIMQNLVKMAKNGDYQGVEKVARNMFKEQGRDFDAEMRDFQNFISNFK